MKIKTFIIDAFTNEAFKGNPAGVCLLDNSIEPEMMQAIANEINLSETAFLTDFNTEKAPARFDIFLQQSKCLFVDMLHWQPQNLFCTKWENPAFYSKPTTTWK